MNIAITGHKHGLGQSIYNKLCYYNKGSGHQVVGFDIENGYDIGNRLQMGKILFESKECQVFINNAYHPTGQTELLKFLLKMWEGKPKVIVNIGTFFVNEKSKDWIKNQNHEIYLEQKEIQRDLIRSRIDNNLKIIQVNPGLMKTQFLHVMNPSTVDISKDEYIRTVDCADAVVYALDLLNKNIFIPEIDLLDKRLYN